MPKFLTYLDLDVRHIRGYCSGGLGWTWPPAQTGVPRHHPKMGFAQDGFYPCRVMTWHLTNTFSILRPVAMATGGPQFARRYKLRPCGKLMTSSVGGVKPIFVATSSLGGGKTHLWQNPSLGDDVAPRFGRPVKSSPTPPGNIPVYDVRRGRGTSKI